MRCKLISAAFFLIATPLLVNGQPQLYIEDAGHGPVRGLAFSPDGKLLAVRGGLGRPPILSIWDFANKERISRFASTHGHFFPQFSDDGAFVYSLGSKVNMGGFLGWELYRYNTRTDGRKLVVQSDESEQCHAHWIDQRRVISSKSEPEESRIKHSLRFLEYGANKRHTIVLDESFKLMGFSPNKKLVALCLGKSRLHIYDWENNKKHCELEVASLINQECYYCTFLADNKRIFVVTGGVGQPQIQVWDTSTRKSTPVRGHFVGCAPPGFEPLLSPNGRVLATHAPGAVGFFDTQKLTYVSVVRPKDRIQLHGAAVFTPNGKALVLGESGGNIWAFDVPRLE